MRRKRLSIGLRAALAILTVSLLVTSTWAATHEQVLHSFNQNGTDGFYPSAGLIFDAAGNLYGTTPAGGSGCVPYFGCGTVFELTPTAYVGWTERVLYSFCVGNCDDGSQPFAGLIFDAAGNLYGTTHRGGGFNLGTVFKLSPNGNGGWTETVLHSFSYGTDGIYPSAGLIFDATGNLYGTTTEGGTGSGCGNDGCGTVFELSPNGNGGWTETVLYSFCSQTNCTDGATPVAGLILDAVGNLYGTTNAGGNFFSNCPYLCGTVFKLSPNGNGGWTETVLHSFGSFADGASPYAGADLRCCRQSLRYDLFGRH